MTAIPLKAEMPNGATIGDWLGTAESAANVAASRLWHVRTEMHADPLDALTEAETSLAQALEEVQAVKRQAAIVRAYSVRPTG